LSDLEREATKPTQNIISASNTVFDSGAVSGDGCSTLTLSQAKCKQSKCQAVTYYRYPGRGDAFRGDSL